MRNGKMSQIAKRQVTQPTIFDMHHEGCEICLGDALTLLPELPPAHFRCCVTSPPYWGVRDYDVQGQFWSRAGQK